MGMASSFYALGRPPYDFSIFDNFLAVRNIPGCEFMTVGHMVQNGHLGAVFPVMEFGKGVFIQSAQGGCHIVLFFYFYGVNSQFTYSLLFFQAKPTKILSHNQSQFVMIHTDRTSGNRYAYF
jgi:hypothetical protein